MTYGHRAYWRHIDLPSMLSDHPIGSEFLHFARTIGRDELRWRQNRLFLRCVSRA